MSVNIQSLPAKFNDFCSFIYSLQKGNSAPDIICLQEIWRIQGPEFFNLDGYHPIIYKCRHVNKQGGGVGIYVKNNLDFDVIGELSIFQDRIFESIFIDVKFGNKKFTIGSLYRPGTAHPFLTFKEQLSQFNEIFSNVSDALNSKNNPAYIFGDINLNCLKYGSCPYVTDYVDLLFSHGMLQLITKPSRCTATSATLIDHVITNHQIDKSESILVISKISDHFPVLHYIAVQKPIIPNKTFTCREMSNQNVIRFTEELSNTNWVDITSINDPQLSFDLFLKQFCSLYDRHIPLSTKKFDKNFHKIEPWITSGILTSRRNKIIMEKNTFNNPVGNALLDYKNYRNIYNKLLKAAKKMYFEKELLANQSNFKKTWELINSAMNKKTSKGAPPSHITINGNNISDPLFLANAFNDYFTSIATNIVDDINPIDPPPVPDPDPADGNPVFSFFNDPLSVNELINATKSLQPKKTADLTGILVWLLQQVIVSISLPLHHIFTQSFTSGVVPLQLKVAKVIPVFKSGQKDLLDNYRPISLLSCFSKIIEKIVCNRLTTFLDSNNLISNFQFGFRKGHSTIHPLIHFLNTVSSALDRKEHSIAIFCDLRKAFDTVNHKILLSKMKKLGIGGVELRWFQNYLVDRRQLVHIGGLNSKFLDVLTGVPQGSILGPLLFLIYINDLPMCSELIALLFADDTTLILSDSNIDLLVSRVNIAFKHVCDFFRLNKLALHPAKTKFMLFTNCNELKNKDVNIILDFNNSNTVPDPNLLTNLERITAESSVPAIKFLGILIDPQLSFKFHIDFLTSKISKAMYFLKQCKKYSHPPSP